MAEFHRLPTRPSAAASAASVSGGGLFGVQRGDVGRERELTTLGLGVEEELPPVETRSAASRHASSAWARPRAASTWVM